MIPEIQLLSLMVLLLGLSVPTPGVPTIANSYQRVTPALLIRFLTYKAVPSNDDDSSLLDKASVSIDPTSGSDSGDSSGQTKPAHRYRQTVITTLGAIGTLLWFAIYTYKVINQATWITYEDLGILGVIVGGLLNIEFGRITIQRRK